MTRPAFQRDNILTPDERATSARKCISLLSAADLSYASDKDLTFFMDQRAFARSIRYAPSEGHLMWLRDMCERYTQ